MDKCRICLQEKRKLNSIYDKFNNISYEQMIICISKLKIVKDDGITKVICNSCKKKLQEAYSFKQLIEKSDYILHNNDHLKIIYFDDYEDIKLKVELLEKYFKGSIPLKEDFIETHFRNGISCLIYNNTIIKKTGSTNSITKTLEHIKTIKVENNDYSDTEENSDYIDYVHHISENDVVDDEYTLLKPKKRMWSSRKFYQLPAPLKPTFIKDIRLYRATDGQKKKYYYKRIREERICPYCGKISKNMHSHLLKHTVSEYDKKYKCDICSKAFHIKALLRSHLLKHSGKKDFRCNQCVATFFDNGTLKRHMILHTTEKHFSCGICNKAYKRKHTLRRHIRIHNITNRKINCDLCNMTFFTKCSLKTHMLVHTDERRFRCEICSQPYKNKRDFNKHCFKKHGVTMKQRPIYVLNKDVLIQEKALMRELMLKLQGATQDDKPINPFEGPRAALAFENFVKVLKSGQISIDL